MKKDLTQLQEAYQLIYINESVSPEVAPFTSPDYLNNPDAKSYAEHLARGIIAHGPSNAKHIFGNSIGMFTGADVSRSPNNPTYTFTKNFLNFIENGDYNGKEDLLRLIQSSVDHYKKYV